MIITLDKLWMAHAEWLGKRSTLTGPEKRYFHRWVLSSYPEFQRAARTEPALFRQECLQVQRGFAFPKQRGIGKATLERYARPLLDRYLLEREIQKVKFTEFLERVLAECKTERALRRYLNQPRK